MIKPEFTIVVVRPKIFDRKKREKPNNQDVKHEGNEVSPRLLIQIEENQKRHNGH